jgi:putative membrane protein
MQGRDAAIIIGVTVLIVLAFGLLGGGMMGGGVMGPGMMNWGGVGIWWIAMLLFWGLVIAGIVMLVVWLVRQTTSTGASSVARGSRAQDILRERYARGDITREQFEQMRQDIERE